MASIAKIVLKNCTKISLNERFTAYRQQAQNAATFRQKSVKQASVENTRLAQQMAKRPTVIAALRLKRRSLQQRLGQKNRAPVAGSVKSRLDFGPRANIHRRLGISRSSRGRIRRGSNRGSYARPGTSPLLKARLGASRGIFKKFMPRNQFIGQGSGRNYLNSTKTFGKQRRGRGGNTRLRSIRGGRSRWNRGQPMPTKQELDTQLDEYMAETKSPHDVQTGAFVGSHF